MTEVEAEVRLLLDAYGAHMSISPRVCSHNPQPTSYSPGPHHGDNSEDSRGGGQRTIFLGNVSHSVTEADIEAIIEPIAPVCLISKSIPAFSLVVQNTPKPTTTYMA